MKKLATPVSPHIIPSLEDIHSDARRVIAFLMLT